MKQLFLLGLTALAIIAGSYSASAQEIDSLVVEIRTGGDDLRGNDDNAFVSIVSYRGDGRPYTIGQQLNTDNRRLPDYTQSSVSFELPEGTEVSDVAALHLRVEGFSGGFDGDNWNVDAVRVTATRHGAIVAELMNEYASPLLRFTGNFHRFSRRFRVQ